MKAMILAAGHGKRMRPLTDQMPKPLLEVGNKSLIVWHILNLKVAGITDIVVNQGWQGYKLPEFLGDGSQWGVTISYSDEQETGPLETAGGIFKALSILGTEPFIVVNGDIWCDFPYQQLKLAADDLAHLILVPNPAHNPNGDFQIQQRRVLDSGTNKYTFSGIGCYHPDLFGGLKDNKAAPLAPLLRRAMSDGKVSGDLFTGDWRDIGTPERLQDLNHELLQAKMKHQACS